MLIDKAQKKFNKQKIEPNSLDSLRWFKRFFENAARQSFKDVKDLAKRKSQVRPGKIYTYGYDPKHKAKLPYYDRVPLIVCLEIYKDGWLGLNLHYLSPKHRLAVMEILYKLYDEEKQKLRINYARLGSLGKHKLFSHCIKRYLANHLMTPLMNIEPENWDMVAFLPFARFVGEKEKTVWKDF